MTTAPVSLPPLTGLHHVTGITGDAQANVDFYTRTLGLRLVKLTVNYDDPASYHLYYGDSLGRPGTILTFFAWPGGRRASAGAGQVSETAFAIPTRSAAWWHNHLGARNAPGLQLTRRFDAPILRLRDPDGLPLALVETPDAPELHRHSLADVPAEHAIRGFHGVTLRESAVTLPAEILVGRFGYRETAREKADSALRVRYQSQGGERAVDQPARAVDVLTTTESAPARIGVGEIHHVAFRVPNDELHAQWLARLQAAHLPVSSIMDRDYFHSIYFREPGGTLFELATDTPGFTKNESPEQLGSRLQLPAWLESQRASIEAILPPLKPR